MSGPHRTALATLRRIAEELRRGVEPEDRFVLAKLAREAVELLERGADRKRMSTAALAERVGRLEWQLADRPAAERAQIIRERLGLSKSAFYRIRRYVQKSH